MSVLRVLLLGGTSEASALARLLADDPRFAPMLSLAGRTRSPAPSPVPSRIGGFGGVDGLVTYLRESGTQAVVDATHPFAVRISANAFAACGGTGVPILRLTRPPWRAEASDRWNIVESLAEAAVHLGAQPRRALLTVGRHELAPFRDAPQHHYVVRSVDPPAAADLPPHADVIGARGPFREDDEIALLRDRRIDVLVTKNSGGAATAAKLTAARRLGISVLMVQRPPATPHGVPCTHAPEDAIIWLAARHAEAARGV